MGGVFGAIFGGRTSREKRQDNEFERLFTPLVNQQAESSRVASGMARDTLGRAGETLNPALDFFSKAASGDSNALRALLAPELGEIGEQAAGQARSVSEFAPRGGRRSERMGQISDDETSAIDRILLSLRPAANDKLSELAQLLFGVGTTELNASTGASGNALQALLGNRGLNLQERGMRVSNLNNQMEGIGQLLAMLA